MGSREKHYIELLKGQLDKVEAFFKMKVQKGDMSAMFAKDYFPDEVDAWNREIFSLEQQLDTAEALIRNNEDILTSANNDLDRMVKYTNKLEAENSNLRDKDRNQQIAIATLDEQVATLLKKEVTE